MRKVVLTAVWGPWCWRKAEGQSHSKKGEVGVHCWAVWEGGTAGFGVVWLWQVLPDSFNP